LYPMLPNTQPILVPLALCSTEIFWFPSLSL